MRGGRLRWSFDLARAYWLESIIVVFALALVGTTFFQVVNRYFLRLPIAWTEEAARYLSVWTVLLGAARCAKEQTHIRVGIIVDRLPAKAQRGIAVAGNVLCIGFLVVLIQQALDIMPFIARQRSAAMQIPMTWVYAAGPVGAAIMVYFLAVQTFRLWRGPWDRAGGRGGDVPDPSRPAARKLDEA
jgi:TRAP-type transport system small permease protein